MTNAPWITTELIDEAKAVSGIKSDEEIQLLIVAISQILEITWLKKGSI